MNKKQMVRGWEHGNLKTLPNAEKWQMADGTIYTVTVGGYYTEIHWLYKK
ncbi:MAG: hypothetical protein ACU837_10685 [Gammaproteobacteria bacterium]